VQIGTSRRREEEEEEGERSKVLVEDTRDELHGPQLNEKSLQDVHYSNKKNGVIVELLTLSHNERVVGS